MNGYLSSSLPPHIALIGGSSSEGWGLLQAGDVSTYRTALVESVHQVDKQWTVWLGPKGGLEKFRLNLAVISPGVACVLAGPPMLSGEDWQHYLARTNAKPILWRTRRWREVLEGWRPVSPAVRFLPLELALRLNPQELWLATELQPSTIGRYAWGWPVLTPLEMKEIIPLLGDSRVPADKGIFSAHAGVGCLEAQSGRNVTEPKDTPVDLSKVSVSVLMAARNAETTIGLAIRSVLIQGAVDWELIVVDDGSSDGTAALVESLSQGLSTELEFIGLPKFHRLRLLRLGKNQGKAYALNQGLSLVVGTYVLELDADDWLSPEAVIRLGQGMMDSSPDVGMWTSAYHRWQRTRRGDLFYKGAEPAVQQNLAWEGLQKGRVPIPRVYRTSLLRHLGGWPMHDSSGGRWFEDVALTSQVLRYARLAVLPGCLYHRVIHPDSVSQAHRQDYSNWVREWFASRGFQDSPS